MVDRRRALGLGRVDGLRRLGGPTDPPTYDARRR